MLCILVFYHIYYLQIFHSSPWYHLKNRSFFILMKSSSLVFYVLCFWCCIQNIFALPKMSKVSPLLSSRIFIVIGFAFRFMKYFALIFIFSTKYGLKNFFAYVYPLFWHFLLKREYFTELPLYFDEKSVYYMWFYFWILYSSPGIYLSIFTTLQLCSTLSTLFRLFKIWGISIWIFFFSLLVW